MTRFDLHKLREIADEGIARHGLRGYARKLGLDVSTMRSLRDGRDMQISKVLQIVAAMGLSLDLGPAPRGTATSGGPGTGEETAFDAVPIPFHAAVAPSGPAPIAFCQSWLDAQGWRAADLCCVTAPEGVDAGCITPGALCLLDCTTIWPETHAVWAYLENGALNISYLSRPDPGILLLSGGNPSVAPRQISGPMLDTITPLGRVVWTGTTLAQPA